MTDRDNLVFLNLAKSVAEKKVGTPKDVLASAVLYKLSEGRSLISAKELIATLELQRDCHAPNFLDQPFQEAIDEINESLEVARVTLAQE